MPSARIDASASSSAVAQSIVRSSGCRAPAPRFSRARSSLRWMVNAGRHARAATRSARAAGRAARRSAPSPRRPAAAPPAAARRNPSPAAACPAPPAASPCACGAARRPAPACRSPRSTSVCAQISRTVGCAAIFWYMIGCVNAGSSPSLCPCGDSRSGRSGSRAGTSRDTRTPAAPPRRTPRDRRR